MTTERNKIGKKKNRRQQINTSWTSHDLYEMIVALVLLNLSHHILNITKPIGCRETQHHLAIDLQLGHLEILIACALVMHLINIDAKQFLRRRSKDKLQVTA
jgi:hypothetical protein